MSDTVGLDGYCPYGCGRTLSAVVADGRIFCRDPQCPRPTAVAEILVQETEHVVSFGERTFNVLHPLRERIDGHLLECAVGDFLAGLDGPPIPPGRYTLKFVDGAPQWGKLIEMHRRADAWPPR